MSDVFLETDGVNGDESSDNELPSLQKLLSPKMSLPKNLPCSHSINQSVQTARSSATTPPGLMSTPQKRLFNYPEWSLFQAEANNGNSQENPIVIDDDNDAGDLTDRSGHNSHQMTINNPGMEG